MSDEKLFHDECLITFRCYSEKLSAQEPGGATVLLWQSKKCSTSIVDHARSISWHKGWRWPTGMHPKRTSYHQSPVQGTFKCVILALPPYMKWCTNAEIFQSGAHSQRVCYARLRRNGRIGKQWLPTASLIGSWNRGQPMNDGSIHRASRVMTDRQPTRQPSTFTLIDNFAQIAFNHYDCRCGCGRCASQCA
ncbi:hypothetical protein, variant [Exophiala dermatitidis NIH/UT8656]|uniref:Uncharacterized protein n=1 Tax=Exophiala dermatitidis (strain ATCC 34100 / CBS 525.76 / NIH/UT8656) TaxID=858893 RepID=H6BZI7_EXODN|nr:uncharacterized protein HMPREF1120_05101 [Exophiala dermatitidis NIH/UT8656]XP_009157512.1 hypothetical protein, variant [Exophiala dermatitidis NIH/UT8656]EHY57050.1 hypothetical protein, variant [Exophiala dermatitidis NIH/UT8656]EHY57051.1 hypothetical protein HMPREF1120_05101 [Exophiala dermatitidis NIH/UT8656]